MRLSGNLKIKELNDICISTGLSLMNNKSLTLQNLIIHSENSKKLHKFILQNGDVRIFSIDTGLKNLGLTQFRISHDLRLSFESLKICDLDLPKTYSPDIYNYKIASFIKENISLDIPFIALIERQRHRSGGNSIIETIFSLRIVEALLHCIFSFTPNLSSCIGISPVSVTRFFNAILDLEKNTPSSYRSKKNNAVKILQMLGERGLCDNIQKIEYEISKVCKKDDLADSSLQALAFFAWFKNLIKLQTTCV